MAAMMMARLFGEADLQRVAGERSFGRGQGYLDAVGVASRRLGSNGDMRWVEAFR
jgi:hypothetical protein